jgi:hypothetical protein
MTCPAYKIDSNDTGLRYAVEECLKQLPTTPTWFALEPNSYGDFGAKIATVARNPINPSRQRQKGVVTDLDASANFVMDLTQTNHLRLMQGFLFAAAREKPTSAPINGDVIVTTAVATSDDSYAMAAGTADDFLVGHLIMASGYTNSANNGMKRVTTPASGKVKVIQNLVDEGSPPATASIQAIGFQFPASDVQIVMSGSLPRLTSASITLTTLGLLPGEWVYLGGDGSLLTFATNKGFGRVKAVTATYIEFDKTTWTPGTEAAGSLTVQMFFGTVVRNEEDPSLIVRQTYQLERTLGEDADGTMSQYVIGAVANELSFDTKQAEKMTVDLAFVGCDAVSYTGLEGLKSGNRPDLVTSDAFNTSSDVKRIAIAVVDPTTSVPTPLFAYCTDISLKIKNSVSGAKAVGTLGNFDTIAGMLDVSGSLSAYFQDTRSIAAVRDNEDITMDMIVAKNNAGIIFDIPLLSLGNGLPKVEQDKPITIPLDTMAAQSSYGHTLLYVNFPYLPDAATA